MSRLQPIAMVTLSAVLYAAKPSSWLPLPPWWRSSLLSLSPLAGRILFGFDLAVEFLGEVKFSSENTCVVKMEKFDGASSFFNGGFNGFTVGSGPTSSSSSVSWWCEFGTSSLPGLWRSGTKLSQKERRCAR